MNFFTISNIWKSNKSYSNTWKFNKSHSNIGKSNKSIYSFSQKQIRLLSNSQFAFVSAICLCSLLALNACTQTIGSAFSDTDVQKIMIGNTQKSVVLDTLGKPYQQTIGVDGVETWTYLYQQEKDSMALMKALPIAKLASGVMPKTKVSRKTLELSFRNDIVATCKLTLFEGEGSGRSNRFSRSQPSMGGGRIRELNCGRK